jgi:Tripartite tricarboxylate transporter TctB family
MSTSGDVAYADLPPAEARAVAASELRGGLAWMVFGIAVLALSWRMDRLEAQHINPYTAPGLLPGLLGIVMILLGGLLALRSWRRGGRFVGGPRRAMSGVALRRLGLVVGLIVAYTVVLLGHGLPFWAGATIYVTASIILLQAPQRAAEGRGLTLREAAFALAVGLASGWVITWVFQDAFLVRLP